MPRRGAAGGWRDALRRLERLEVKACPYVRFAHTGVDFKRPPRRLATLRIQPGGAPRRARDAEFRVFGDENVRRAARPGEKHLGLVGSEAVARLVSSRHVAAQARASARLSITRAWVGRVQRAPARSTGLPGRGQGVASRVDSTTAEPYE